MKALDLETATRAMLAQGEVDSRGRPRRRRTEPRAKTLMLGRASAREAEFQRAITTPLDIPEHQRPTHRGECFNGGHNAVRPCPFVSCSKHLYLDVNESGNVKLNFPGREVWELAETCALDVADRGGATYEDVGAMLNVVRERVRQIEHGALVTLAGRRRLQVLAGDVHDRGELAESDDGSGARSTADAINGFGADPVSRERW